MPIDLQLLLNTELPITVPLGLRVVTADAAHVIVAAPLAPNRNHRGTAFAGSLNAVATLAAWSWFTRFLAERTLAAQVVLQDSSIAYTRPVVSDFTATATAPEEATIARFLAAFRRSGRGRLRLTVDVADASGVAATFSGRYVAERAPSPAPVHATSA
jgi:thioesterase domain-containing protein